MRQTDGRTAYNDDKTMVDLRSSRDECPLNSITSVNVSFALSRTKADASPRHRIATDTIRYNAIHNASLND